MKILLIHNRYTQRGGEDTVFENEMMLLKENKIEVDTIVFENTETKNIFQQLKAALRSIFSIPAFMKVRHRIKRKRPDIVHIHNVFYSASPSVIWAAYLHRIPVVITLHNFRLICPGALFLRNERICELCRKKMLPWHGIQHKCFQGKVLPSLTLAMTLTLHKIIGTWNIAVSRYICLNAFAANIYSNSSLRLPANRISIKANWCYEEEESQPVTKEEHLLFVGRINNEKGIPFLLRTIERTERTLHIIGDGPLIEQVKQLHTPQIKFFGPQDRQTVINAMAKAKALLLPSCWYEMFPMVILESFSVGTPVIASRIGGIPEIIEHGKTGLLFETENQAEFVAMVKWLDEVETYKKMCANVKTEFTKKYTQLQAIKSLTDVYALSMVAKR